MAKGYKSKGRKKTFAKGKRTSTKVVLAQRPRTTYYSPTSWYPPLPAEMRLSLKLSQTITVQVAGLAHIYSGISCVAPISIAGTYPEGFEKLMRLYSRAVVDRVSVTFGFTPSASGQENFDGRLYDPYRVIGGVVPWNDFNDNNNFTPHVFASYPESKTAQIGFLFSQSERVMKFNVDVRKAIGDGREEHYACRSSLVGVITVPVLNANIGASPMIVYMLDNNNSLSNTSRTCFVRREITYHITFSMRHTAQEGA